MQLPPRHWIAYVFRFVVIAIVLAIGMGVTSFLVGTAPQPKKADPERALQTVSVFAAKKVDVRRQWSGFGSAVPVDSADVPARVTAIVTGLDNSIRPGRFVRKDEVIVTLDDTDFQRQLEVADERLQEIGSQKAQLAIESARLKERRQLEEEDLAIARRELANVQMRVDRGAANERELDQPKRAVIAAQRAMVLTNESIDRIPQRLAQLNAMERGLESSKKLAKLSVDRATIKSPIDGIIETVDVELGENVTAGQRVMRIVNLNLMEVPLRLPAAARHDVIVGSEVTLTKKQDEPVMWKGKIARILPSDDEQARSTIVMIEIKQDYANESFGQLGGRNLLTAGAFVTGTAQSATSEKRWVVPRRSIINQRMWLVENDMVVSVPVKRSFLHEGRFPELNLLDDQWAILDESTPIEPGMLILINGSLSVSDGQKIRGVIANPAAADHKDSLPPNSTLPDSDAPDAAKQSSGTRAGCVEASP